MVREVPMGMGVARLVLPVDVEMGVLMGVGMGVEQFPVAMGMGVLVGVGMGVLEEDGISSREKGAQRHHGQGFPEEEAGPLPQKDHGEARSQKGGNSVVGAGLGGPQFPLGQNIEGNAQPIGHKAHQQDHR